MLSRVVGWTDEVRTNALMPLFMTILLSGAMRGYSFPYLNLYLEDRGFSGTAIGAVLSVAALLEFALIPFFSTYADRTRTHRQLFRWLVLTYGAACVLMLIIPHPAVLVVAMLVANLNLRGTFLFGVQLGFTALEQQGKTFFGRMRMASSAGFMLASLTAGFLLSVARYAGLFTAAAVSALGTVSLSGSMPASTSDKPTQVNDDAPPRNRSLYLILVSHFFMTIGFRSGFAFWLIHFQENMGIPSAWIPVIVTLASLFELPFYVSLDPAFRRGYARFTYITGGIMMGLHWIFLGLQPSLFWLVVVLIFRGAAFAMWNLSLLVLINTLSHPRNVATNQALTSITVPSIAGLISGAPLGYVYDHYPPLVFFTLCAVTMFVGTAIMIGGSRWFTTPPPVVDATP